MLGQTGASYFSYWMGLLSTLSPPILLAGSIFLIERRGKGERIDRHRHVDIWTLLESIPEAAIIIDTNNQIVDANSAAAQMLGVTREELLHISSHRVTKALTAIGDGAPQDGPVLPRALKGESVRQECRVVQSPKTGQDLDLLVSATPMRNERGDVIAALLIARDVTELHALQRRMGDLERHLAIGQMAAALAHDFNNILAGIGQAAYVLQNIPPSTDKDRGVLIDLIQNAVRRGGEIIGRVREYLRTGSGATGPVDVRQVMQEAVELTRILWSNARVRLTSELQPVGRVRANAGDLRRVFTNLIINALEAMPDGGNIQLTCQERGGNVIDTVIDPGSGIAHEVRKKIFYPYFTTKQKGTGLGLSGAQKIVLSQGGNISFRTEVGKGTTFIVSLPRMDEKGYVKSKKSQPAA